MGKESKRKAGGRKKNIQELFGQRVEMQLSYNFTWTIKSSDHPKFLVYHIRIILYPVPSFCSLWTADVFRVVASLPPKILEGEKRRPEIRLQFAG